MLKLLRETIDRLRYKIPQRPHQVQLEITNRCNMDCPMCPREVMGIELEHMDWARFMSVAGRLTHRENITLTGWGEPFLHPKIFDMIAYCRERGHTVFITSNGLFPRPGLAEDIVRSGVDGLTFSVDSLNGHVENGHTNNKVFDNIEAVARLRKNRSPSLRLQATLHKDRESDLFDVIRYGARIGCDVVNVGRIDRKYDAGLQRPGAAEEERIFHQADRLARDSGIQLDWLQYSVSTGMTRFFYRLLRKKLHRSGRYCLKTFDYAYVNRDGDVTPCCLLPQTRMGNAAEGDLREIWQSGRFNEFRENFRQTCGSCDLWTVEMIDK